MAVPSTTSDGTKRDATTRNPRRRQRPDQESPVHPRRKRSKVSDDACAHAIHLERETASHTNGHADSRRRRSTTTPGELLPTIPVRGNKPSQKRFTKSDASTLMTQNSHYSLRHLPSTPDAIRNSGCDFNASFLTSTPLALAVDSDRAYIWDYTASSPVTHPKIFDIPTPPRPSDPLPLAALVTNGASTSIGLLIVAASTGKVTFWENIDTAESLSLFQHRQNGVQGSLGGFFSGETAVSLTSADHAGFLVTLSSGRIAHLALRDAQGKPHLSTQFLRSNEATGGGLFGSIKGVLGVGWKRDVVRVRTRSQGSRGQMHVISVTAGAHIQMWDLTWSGHSAHRASIDFKQQLQTEFAKLLPSHHPRTSTVRLVDFAVLSRSGRRDELATLGDNQPIDLVMLAVSEDSGKPLYALVDVTVTDNQAYIERMITLRGDLPSIPTDAPSLSIPHPGHTAFVIFATKIAIVSLAASTPDGPEAQLLMETHVAQESFQDVLHLRQDKRLAIQGYCEADDASCLVFIKEFGLASLVAAEPIANAKPRMAVQSRFEQAVCFGAKSDNVIDFDKFDALEHNQDDVENAAIKVSREIVRSESPYFSASAAGVTDSLEARAKAVNLLVVHLRRHYGPLSPPTRWKLLADAEKIAAGSALWQSYESGVMDSAPRPSVLPAVVKVLKKQTQGAKFNDDAEETDELRAWFLHDLDSIDKLYYQALQLVNHGYESGTLQNLMKLLSESDDIIFAVYETVHAFRIAHAKNYDIDPSTITDGVLEQGSKDLPEPWTSTHETINLLDRFIDIARNYTVDFYEKPENQRESDNTYVIKVINENVRLVEILCRCYRERIAWCAAHFADKYRNYAPGLSDKFKRSREHHLRGLVKIGQAGAGLSIAERYKDMDSLVRLVVSETAYLVESFEEPGLDHAERQVINARMDELQGNVERYFGLYGDAWATAFFDSHLASHRSSGLLSSAASFQGPLTRYLRAEKVRGRLGWINEVLHEKDLSRAMTALTTLAQEQEVRLWNKKVELSLGKLACLASAESENDTVDKPSRVYDDELSVIGVQEDIYRHLTPTLYGALDKHAELQLVTDAYAISIRRTLPALHQLLELAFDDLLNHKVLTAEQIIDILTLMDSVPSADAQVDISGREFFLAFKVLSAVRGSMAQERLEMVWRVVWKRLFLVDEWDMITATKGKSEIEIQALLSGSTLCQTIALVLQDETLSRSFSIPTATQCIGAGSSSTDLAHRYPTPELCGPIMHDNAAQDKRLSDQMKNGFDQWIASCRREAEKLVEVEKVDLRNRKAELERVRKDVSEADNRTTGGEVNGSLLVVANGDDGPSFDEDPDASMADVEYQGLGD